MKPISPTCPDCGEYIKFQGLHGVWQGVCVNEKCPKTIVSDREVWKREDQSPSEDRQDDQQQGALQGGGDREAQPPADH